MRRTWLAALAISIAAMTAAGVLGVAGADPVGPGTQRSITVNGAGSKAIAKDASSAQRAAAYDEALGAALDQARARAELMARKLGVSVGQVVTAAEQSQEDPYPCGGVMPLAEKRRSRPARRAAVSPPQECREYASVSVTYLIG